MPRTVVAAALMGLALLAAGVTHAQQPAAPTAKQPVAAAKKPPAKETCITKAGEATGVTRGFAEYEALLIIRQVSGNWPIESDRIGPAKYDCRQGQAGWTCKAVAKICKR